MAFWAGGFASAYARFAPGTQTMLSALRMAAADGVRRADLGGGDQDYKRRLADENRPVRWRTLFPRGWRYPLITIRLAPKRARLRLRSLARRLPPNVQARVRGLLGRHGA